MDETFEIDVDDVIDMLSYRTPYDVWNQCVEREDNAEIRIYWRGVFFEAIIQVRIFMHSWLGVPDGKDFVNMIIKFSETI